VGPNGLRRVAARDFFIDIFSTVLEPDEILASVYIPRPRTGMHFVYRKIRHPASGFAVVGIAVGVRLQEGAVDEISIGVTGAANHAFAGQRASDFLIGKTLSPDYIEQTAKLLSETTECLSDRYASAEYRANLIRIETRRALFALAS
jgi:carbon-monoxide dehydrogenase medium subunit